MSRPLWGSRVRLVALGSVIALLASFLTGALISQSLAAGAPDITLDKTGPEKILIGEDAEFTLAVSTPSGAATPAYNVSFRDVLPVGVAYKSGSVSPSTVGEPTIIANKPLTGQTTLIWTNVFDVNQNDTAEITYSVTPSTTTYPVGSTFSNSATAYANSDPREVPDFSPTTGLSTGGSTGTDGPEVASTLITAIKIVKTEPSPEHELVRGVHDNSTVYTLTTTNNTHLSTTGIVVVDYVPATLEFLGCGLTDNTSPGVVEYVGAARLTVVPAAPAPCPTPTSVITGSFDPDGTGPAGTGIYTQVTWPAFTLASGASNVINYRAAAPMYANTLTWSGATPATTGAQGSNLDNNSGASTAETMTEIAATNYASATGTYTGPISGGSNPVSDSTNLTVTIEDLALQKSVTPSDFAISSITGTPATYTLSIQTSEYRTSSDVIVTDDLPDGLTLLTAVGDSSIGSPVGATLLSASNGGVGPSHIIFRLDSTPTNELPINANQTITFQATMSADYDSGAPTAAGDSFRNVTDLTGTTTSVVTPNSPPGPVMVEIDHNVADTSNVTISSVGPGITKLIGQDRTNANCATQTYAHTTPTVPYQQGDKICFQISVPFPAANNTLSPFVTDFLPPELQYIPASQTATASNTATIDSFTVNDTGGTPVPGGSITWQLGDVDADTPRLVVSPGQVFRVQFAATVMTATLSNSTDVTGNLAKFGSVNSAGEATTDRDLVNFDLAASQVAISKGVAQVNGLPVVPNPPNTDHVQVQESDVVTWRVDVSNIGSAAGGSNVPVRNVSVVDTLPTGITCAVVSSISDGGTCTGSTLTWTSGTIAAGASKTFTFDMAVPALVSADISYTNTVNVPSYESENNGGTWTPQNPTNVTDISDVFTADITFTKTGTTSLDLPNNNASSQFTVGEEITYVLDGTVPAQTTAYSGVMTDTLPSGLQAVSCSAEFSADGTVGSLTSTLPLGSTLSSCAAAAVTLTLPATYTNTNPTAAQLFRMTITAKVLGGSYTHGQVKTNSATFVGTNFSKSSSKSATVVIPDPQIAKSNSNPSSGGSVVAGSAVTFTLAVTNPAGTPARPVSYDTIVVDCLPAGIGSPAYGTLPTGVTSDAIVAGDGTNGCATGTTRLGWSVGPVATGATVTLTYTASIDAGQAGSVTFTNTASVTGSSLDNGVRDSTIEGVYTNSSSSSIRSNNGTLTKSVSPTSAAIGETTTWTVTAQIPANLEFWGAAVIDTLPTGVDSSSVSTTSVSCSQPLAPLTCAGTLTPAFGTDLAQVSGPTRIGWLLGDLSPSAQIRTVTIVYTAVVDDVVGNIAGATITNTATFNSNPTGHGTPTDAGSAFEDTSDPATANVTVLEPSLSVLKAVSTGTPTPGSPFNYTITVTNASGGNVSSAYAITIEDVIPTGVVVDDSTISNGGTISGANPTTGGGTITWNVAGPIAAGASFDRTYSATIPSGTTVGTFVNTVDIPSYDSFTSNPRTYNNVTPDTASVTVSTASADMSITKTHTGIPTPSESVTFTLRVRNLGPSDAVGPITVVDTLPAGLTYISAGSNWSCSPVGQVITCLLLPLAPVTGMVAGDTAPDLLISTWVSSAIAPTTWTNSATVSSTSTDPVPGNNTATDVVNVVPVPPAPGPGPSVSPTPTPTPTVSPTPTPTPTPTPSGSVVVGGGKPQKPNKPLNLGNVNIKPGKWQNLIVSSLTTNAGNKVQASVQCRYANASDIRTRNVAGQAVPAGDITLCQLRNHRGMIQVRVVVPGPVVVRLVLFAPARNGFSAYSNTSTWIARGNI